MVIMFKSTDVKLRQERYTKSILNKINVTEGIRIVDIVLRLFSINSRINFMSIEILVKSMR